MKERFSNKGLDFRIHQVKFKKNSIVVDLVVTEFNDKFQPVKKGCFMVFQYQNEMVLQSNYYLYKHTGELKLVASNYNTDMMLEPDSLSIVKVKYRDVLKREVGSTSESG